MADEKKPQTGRHPHVRRVLLASTAALSALVMLVGVVGAGAYFWTSSKIQTYTPIAEASPGSGTGDEEPDVAGKCDTRSCNYLLLGSDSREGLSKEEQIAFGTDEDIGGENRSDTIILVHTEPKQRRAVFLSFPRDLWVEIPGRGEGKINSAFEGGINGGGPEMVARTVKALTGLRINHILYVDLARFQGLVDTLDGVDMCVPYPMQDPLTGLDIGAGCQRFDGATALAYVRTRHQVCDKIPDFARIGRQQQFLRAVISKLLSPSELLKLPTLVPKLVGNFVVDPGLANPAELVYLAGQLNGVNTGAADFRSVPTTTDGIYVDGQYLSIVRAVEPAANDLFRALREGRPLGDLGKELPQTPPSPANVAVEVYDHRSLGKALGVLQTLTQGGFLTSPTTLDYGVLGQQVKGSAILFAPGEEAKAEVVAQYVGTLELQPAPRSVLGDADVAVVIGPNYEPPDLTKAPPQTSADCPT
ncbi:MAG TPA: LCP family protein [Actinomycetota bacterium]|nr:LCP family protein [Actinomycetota bacterium]